MTLGRGVRGVLKFIGPVASGAAMDWFGDEAMFAAGLIAVLAVVVGWGVVRQIESLRRKDDLHFPEKSALPERTAA